MPTLEEVDSFIYENLTNVKTTKNGTHFNARCPICGDSKKSLSKKRFHLQFDDENSIYWKCFNCNESGNFYSLYSSITGVTDKEAWKKFNGYSADRVKNNLTKPNRKQQIKQNNRQTFNYILNDCLSVNSVASSHLQKQYIKCLKDFINTRKIKQDLFVAYKGQFEGRIIIPVYDDKDIVYFQGRRINDKMEPKYLNPSCNKEQIVLNKDNFNINKKIIICEGLIDADTIGKQATCMLGKELNEEVFRELYYKYKQGIILLMDNDQDGMDKLKDYSMKYKDMCKYFLMPNIYKNYKDLNEIVMDNINISNMYDFVVNNSYSYLQIQMQLKMKKGLCYDFH